MHMKGILFSSLLGLAAVGAAQSVRTQDVTYREGSTDLQGYLAATGGNAKRPGVLIFHDWNSIDDYERGRARQLAQMGFVALAADIYGKGVRPTTPQESGAQAGRFRNDRTLLRARVNAALDALRNDPRVDPNRVVAIGYCFGGTAALELARSGAPVKGVVSFHGGLGSPTPGDAKNISGKVLALHGADDPNVPPAEVQAFGKEMSDAKVDWQLVAYGGAVHSFTEPSAGNDPSRGNAYDARADKRSWEDMKQFFREVIGARGLRL